MTEAERTDFWQVLVLAVVLIAVAAYVALAQPAPRPVHPAIAPGVTAVHFPTKENP